MIANIAQYFKLACRGEKKKKKENWTKKNVLNLFLKDDLEGIVKTFLFFSCWHTGNTGNMVDITKHPFDSLSKVIPVISAPSFPLV